MLQFATWSGSECAGWEWLFSPSSRGIKWTQVNPITLFIFIIINQNSTKNERTKQ